MAAQLVLIVGAIYANPIVHFVARSANWARPMQYETVCALACKFSVVSDVLHAKGIRIN